jgi:O-glycosyl hydrolase
MKDKASMTSSGLIRRPRAALVFTLIWLLTSCRFSARFANAEGGAAHSVITVSLDRSHRFQTIEGFGAEIGPWLGPRDHNCIGHDTVPDSEKTQILDHLYTDLGLTTERSYLGFQGPGGDFDKFQELAPIFAQASQRVQANGDQFRYGFGGFVTAPFRDSSGRLASDGATRYANWAVRGLQQIKSQLGLVVDYWDIAPEPDGVGHLTPIEFKQLVAATGSAFREAGLSTEIAVPRVWTVQDFSEYATPVLRDRSTLPYVKQLDFHEYDYDASQGQSPDITDRQIVRDLADKYGLTVAQRETSTDVKKNQNTFWNGTYDQAMAWANDALTDMVEANAGAWDLIMAYYAATPRVGLSSYVVTNYDSGCNYTGFQIPPHYWTIRQFVKFVRPGAVRIRASSSSGDIRVAAFVDAKHQQTIVVAINNARNDLGAKFSGVPNGSASVVQTTPVKNGAQLPPVTAVNDRFAATLPARSVTTFVFGPNARNDAGHDLRLQGNSWGLADALPDSRQTE